MNNELTIIKSKWIIPINPSNQTLAEHAIVIEGTRIKDILPGVQAEKRYPNATLINKKEHILMPGLINAHAHSPMNLLRGLADDLPLQTWLQQHMWPAEAAVINPSSVTIGSMLSIAEMLRGGTTCFNDHYFFAEQTKAAAIESGIRATLGFNIMNVKTQYASDENECFNKIESILNDTPHPRIQWALAPHSTYMLSEPGLERLYQTSQEYDLRVHIHLHETAKEVSDSKQHYQLNPLELMHKYNLMNDKLMAVHMVHLTDADIERVATTNAHVVHSPQSNLKLGSGIAPVAALMSAGVNIALGTDGCASNNDVDMFSEMKTAALLAKGSTHNPGVCKASEVLAMATINGAKALGLEAHIGSLEIGKQADIIAIDCADYWQQPVTNPAAHLVYSGNRLAVSDVWVAGTPLLKNKELTTINTDKLLEELQPIHKKLQQFSYIP